MDVGVWLGGLTVVGGFGAWLIALTFMGGRLYERINVMSARLEAGDRAFSEIRAEQSAVTKVLQELRSANRIESQRNTLMHRQTKALWLVVARIDPKAAAAAQAAAA